MSEETKIDMNVETNELVEVLKKRYEELKSTTIKLLPFEKYVDLVLRQEEMKRFDRMDVVLE